VEDVCECRRGCWRYLGIIGVVDVVVAAVQQVQKKWPKSPVLMDSITNLPIEQCYCFGAINSSFVSYISFRNIDLKNTDQQI
jgi:hypothetical protein